MSSLNTSVLVAARETYTEHLKNYLSPLIFEGFVSVYEDSIEKENNKPEFNYNYLKQFQTQLKNIPFWNQTILEEETRRIITKVDFLMKILAAVFVSYVKILASVRIGGQSDKIRIKVPHADVFIHTVYCKAAEIIYYDPFKFRNYQLRENRDYILFMICRSIDLTINNMIPIENILKEYLSSVYSGYIKQDREYINNSENGEINENSGNNENNENSDYSATFNGDDLGLNDKVINDSSPNFNVGGDKDSDILDENFSAGFGHTEQATENLFNIDENLKQDPITDITDMNLDTQNIPTIPTVPTIQKLEDPFSDIPKVEEQIKMDDIFSSEQIPGKVDDIFNNPTQPTSDDIFSKTSDIVNFEKELL